MNSFHWRGTQAFQGRLFKNNPSELTVINWWKIIVWRSASKIAWRENTADNEKEDNNFSPPEIN